MVLISKKHKYIYIHIPKTGGTTIKNTLYPKAKKGELLVINMSSFTNITCENTWHLTYEKILEKYKINDVNKYFTFTFVRNPYDRLYSSYLYGKKQAKMILNETLPYFILLLFILFFLKKKILWFIFFSLMLISSKFIKYAYDFLSKGFDVFVLKNFNFSYHVFPDSLRTQKSYIGKNKLDFIGREEFFERDFKFVMNKIGLKNKIQNKNIINKRTANSHGYKYIDKFKKKTIEFVNKFYKEDFEEFGYAIIKV